MNAATAPVTSDVPSGQIDISGTRKVPFTRLVKVELRKSLDTKAGAWLLGITALLVIAAMVIAMIVTVTQDIEMNYGGWVATTGYSSGLLLPIIGIMLVTSEWTQRTAMGTFTLESNRARVLLAKLVVGVLLALIFAALALVVGAVVNVIYGAASSFDTSWDLGTKYFVGFVVTQVISMVIGFALATLLLSTPAAIVVYFVYQFVLPGIFELASSLLGWFADIRPWIDFGTAQVPLNDGTFNAGDHLAHLLVSGFIWLVVPFALGLIRVLRAEVK